MSPTSGGNVSQVDGDDFIIGRDDLILVTGATGFVGSRVVESLLDRGFRNIRCFSRSSSEARWAGVQLVRGNLLSRQDCIAATENVSVVLHLAAGRGENFYPHAFMNSVVTTRNLLDACVQHNCSTRTGNGRCFPVYTN